MIKVLHDHGSIGSGGNFHVGREEISVKSGIADVKKAEKFLDASGGIDPAKLAELAGQDGDSSSISNADLKAAGFKVTADNFKHFDKGLQQLQATSATQSTAPTTSPTGDAAQSITCYNKAAEEHFGEARSSLVGVDPKKQSVEQLLVNPDIPINDKVKLLQGKGLSKEAAEAKIDQQWQKDSSAINGKAEESFKTQNPGGVYHPVYTMGSGDGTETLGLTGKKNVNVSAIGYGNHGAQVSHTEKFTPQQGQPVSMAFSSFGVDGHGKKDGGADVSVKHNGHELTFHAGKTGMVPTNMTPQKDGTFTLESHGKTVAIYDPKKETLQFTEPAKGDVTIKQTSINLDNTKNKDEVAVQYAISQKPQESIAPPPDINIEKPKEQKSNVHHGLRLTFDFSRTTVCPSGPASNKTKAWISNAANNVGAVFTPKVEKTTYIGNHHPRLQVKVH